MSDITASSHLGSSHQGRPAPLAQAKSLPMAAIAGVVLSGALILGATNFFSGQADRQTASALAQGQATLLADSVARGLSSDTGVARDTAVLQQALGTVSEAEGLRQVRVVDTLARTVIVLHAAEGAPAPAGSRTAITDAQKPLFDFALKARSDMPAEGFAPATGFVGSDGAGFGVQAVRSDGAAAGMVEVQLEPIAKAPSFSGLPLFLILGLMAAAIAGLILRAGKSGGGAIAIAATALSATIVTAFASIGAGASIGSAGASLSTLASSLSGTITEGTATSLFRPANPNALAITLGLIGLMATGLCWAFVSGAMGRLWETIKTYRTAYLYIAPAIILLILLSFFPFFYGIAMSFTNTTLLNGSDPFIDRLNGLDNYAAILGDFNLRQPETGVLNYQNFYWTAFMTVIWTVSNVFLGVSIGLGLALLLNIKGLKGVAIYRTLLILPWALPNYITALTWKGLFHPQFGAFNSIIQAFGGEPVKWFDTLWPAFFTGLATNAWLSFPFMMVVALGALQSIDQGMYEAAKIDGASPWQRFTMITLPSLKPALLPAIIVSVVWTFNMFNVIFLVSAGQPSGGTEILITRAYKVAFEEYRYGYAAAYSVVIFIILLIYGVFQVRATKATEANA